MQLLEESWRLDLGSGRNPTQGYVGVDLTESPHIRAHLSYLPFRSASAQRIVLKNVIEHVDSIATMREVSRVLANRGQLLVTTPNAMFLECLVDYARFGRYATSPGHMQTFSIYELRNLLGKFGLHVQDWRVTDYAQRNKPSRTWYGHFFRLFTRVLPHLGEELAVIAQKNEP